MREPSRPEAEAEDDGRVRQRQRPPVWARPRGERERPARGPQPSLSVAGIVAAAVALADAEGIDAVSMRRVAAELGSGTMSLYRYVPTKDDLFDLMADQVMAECCPEEPPRSPREGGDWRAGLREMAVTARRSLLAHPWAGPILASRPPLGPNALRRSEYLLRLVDGLGLSIEEMSGVVGVVFSYVNGVVFGEIAQAEVARRTGVTEDEWRASVGPYVHELISEGDYPLSERYLLEADDHPDPEALFTTGLETILTGLSTRLPPSAS